jgi:hypothetical protein
LTERLTSEWLQRVEEHLLLAERKAANEDVWQEFLNVLDDVPALLSHIDALEEELADADGALEVLNAIVDGHDMLVAELNRARELAVRLEGEVEG